MTLSPDQQAAVINMYESGMSAAMLAQYFAVSLGEIYRILRNNDIPLRKQI